MISSKQDLKYYLLCDKIALYKKTHDKPRFRHDLVWKYQILLRKCEYLQNCKRGLFWKLISKIYKLRFVNLGYKLGFSISFNVFEEGLSIAHYGCIVVNNNAKIGKNCRIHEGVTIGITGDRYIPGTPENDEQIAAIIGDNVFIGTGAKIIGAVKIADGVVIGANSVVTKDILEPNITVGGIPAKKISDKGSEKYIVNVLEEMDNIK